MTLLNRETLAGSLDAAAGCLPVRYITYSRKQHVLVMHGLPCA
jgi:hypothetical protein